MTILILGSEGFIGSHLISYYLSKGYTVYGADLMETGTQKYNYYKISRLSPEYDELLQQNKFDACINAAGSGNVTYSMAHPITDFEANSLDVIRLLDGIRRYRPNCKYLHISSAAVYGNPVVLPVKEIDDLKPLSPYGWHKLISEKICKEYTSIFNIRTAIARPFSVYGSGLRKQLFWDLYQKIRDAENNSKIELWGTGNESRDFIFISDLVKSFDCILQNAEMQGEEYNVASGKEVTIKEVTQLLLEEYGKSLTIEFNQLSRKGDPANWKADTDKIRGLGFDCQVTIEEGVKHVTTWLKNQN